MIKNRLDGLLKNLHPLPGKARLLAAILFLPAFFSCASRNVSVIPTPDLAFTSAQQRPTAAVRGEQVQLAVVVSNIGTSWAPAVKLRLKDDGNHVLAEKDITSLHPQVSVTVVFDLPFYIPSKGFFLTIDPEHRIFEQNRGNNILQFVPRFVSAEEKKELERKQDEEFLAFLKKNNWNECEPKVVLSDLKRVDKIMGYETAVSGETVKFMAVVENRCNKDIYDLSLHWAERDSKENSSREKMFGQTRIDKLLPGEKRIIYRSLTVETGRWYISLKLSSANATDSAQARYLDPAFVLTVEPAAE